MQLSDLKVEDSKGGSEVSWKVDGRVMQVVYYDSPAIHFAADMALITCLVPAMQLRQDMQLDETFVVSQRLLQNLEQFQSIYSSWFSHLGKVGIFTANVNMKADDNSQPGLTACFFSGGVDASYTFLTEQQQIGMLLFCNGLDIQLTETERFATAKQQGQMFAKAFGQTFCIVETNFRQIFPADSHYYSQVIVLIGFAIGLGLKKLLVPASHTLNQLTPFGSHPLTDPLITNGHTDVIHHGMTARTIKTKLISEYPIALDILRVCNASDLYNCGKCEKCLRTMTTLAVYDKSSASLPALTDVKQLANVKLWDDEHFILWRDIMLEAEAKQKPMLAKAAQRICLSYRRRKLAKHMITELKSIFASRAVTSKYI